MSKVICPRCSGEGKVDSDKETGTFFRFLRLKKGLLQKDVAAKMGVSPQFVCDLERGRRIWNTAARDSYKKALKDS